jgi:hypothetical protein
MPGVAEQRIAKSPSLKSSGLLYLFNSFQIRGLSAIRLNVMRVTAPQVACHFLCFDAKKVTKEKSRLTNNG